MAQVKQTAPNVWSVMQRVYGNRWRVVSSFRNEAEAQAACDKFNA